MSEDNKEIRVEQETSDSDRILTNSQLVSLKSLICFDQLMLKKGCAFTDKLCPYLHIPVGQSSYVKIKGEANKFCAKYIRSFNPLEQLCMDSNCTEPQHRLATIENNELNIIPGAQPANRYWFTHKWEDELRTARADSTKQLNKVCLQSLRRGISCGKNECYSLHIDRNANNVNLLTSFCEYFQMDQCNNSAVNGKSLCPKVHAYIYADSNQVAKWDQFYFDFTAQINEDEVVRKMLTITSLKNKRRESESTQLVELVDATAIPLGRSLVCLSFVQGGKCTFGEHCPEVHIARSKANISKLRSFCASNNRGYSKNQMGCKSQLKSEKCSHRHCRITIHDTTREIYIEENIPQPTPVWLTDYHQKRLEFVRQTGAELTPICLNYIRNSCYKGCSLFHPVLTKRLAALVAPLCMLFQRSFDSDCPSLAPCAADMSLKESISLIKQLNNEAGINTFCDHVHGKAMIDKKTDEVYIDYSYSKPEQVNLKSIDPDPNLLDKVIIHSKSATDSLAVEALRNRLLELGRAVDLGVLNFYLISNKTRLGLGNVSTPKGWLLSVVDSNPNIFEKTLHNGSGPHISLCNHDDKDSRRNSNSSMGLSTTIYPLCVFSARGDSTEHDAMKCLDTMQFVHIDRVNSSTDELHRLRIGLSKLCAKFQYTFSYKPRIGCTLKQCSKRHEYLEIDVKTGAVYIDGRIQDELKLDSMQVKLLYTDYQEINRPTFVGNMCSVCDCKVAYSSKNRLEHVNSITHQISLDNSAFLSKNTYSNNIDSITHQISLNRSAFLSKNTFAGYSGNHNTNSNNDRKEFSAQKPDEPSESAFGRRSVCLFSLVHGATGQHSYDVSCENLVHFSLDTNAGPAIEKLRSAIKSICAWYQFNACDINKCRRSHIKVQIDMKNGQVYFDGKLESNLTVDLKKLRVHSDNKTERNNQVVEKSCVNYSASSNKDNNNTMQIPTVAWDLKSIQSTSDSLRRMLSDLIEDGSNDKLNHDNNRLEGQTTTSQIQKINGNNKTISEPAAYNLTLNEPKDLNLNVMIPSGNKAVQLTQVHFNGATNNLNSIVPSVDSVDQFSNLTSINNMNNINQAPTSSNSKTMDPRFDHICLNWMKEGKCTDRHPVHNRLTHFNTSNWAKIIQYDICSDYHRSLDTRVTEKCIRTEQIDHVNRIIYCSAGNHFKVTANKELRQMSVINPASDHEVLDTLPLD